MGKEVAEGAGALIGGALGSQQSGGQSQNQTQSTAPWAPQQPYIQQGLQDAQSVYGRTSAIPLPSQYVEGANPYQTSAAQGLISQGQGGSSSVYDPLYDQSRYLMGQGPAYVNNASGVVANGIGAMSPYTFTLGNYATTGVLGDSGLDNSLVSAATNGVGSLSQGSSLASQVGSMGLNASNGTNAAMQGAQQAISSPTLQAAIDGANSSLNRDLTQNTLPQIRAAAGANGNANSSREGALEATATTNTQQQMLANADSLTNNAFNTGYQGGLSSYETGLNSANSAASNLNYGGSVAGNLGANLNSQQLGALENAGSQALGYQADNTNAKLGANSQLGNAFSQGVSGANSYSNGTLSAQNAALTGANALQSQGQSGINNALEQYQYQTQMPWQNLDNYWNIASKQMGGTSTSTGNTTPNNGGLSGALGGLIGGTALGNGLYQNYGNSNATTIGGYDLALYGTDGFGSASNPWASSMLSG